MANERILIVGAGALGIVTGYHLQMAGAQIDFLVRPGRLPALAKPQLLYSFEDHQLHRFDGYNCYTSVAELKENLYDFVLVALDGATCRGAEATALLAELGDAIRDSSAFVIGGPGGRDHCRDAMKLPDDRVVMGTMLILGYQTDLVELPLNPPTDAAKLAQASLGYKHIGNNIGFMLLSEPAGAGQAFKALYDRSGVSKATIVKRRMFEMFVPSFVVTMAMFDMKGWPCAAVLAADRELLELGSRAIKEAMRLPQFGLMGKMLSLTMGPGRMAKNNLKTEQVYLPVDWSAFNRFHHGGKVREQNIQLLRDVFVSGRSKGRAMPALTELLDRFEAHIRR